MTNPHLKKNVFYVCGWVCVPGCEQMYHVPARACGDQKRLQGHLELEIQVIVAALWMDTGN